MEFIRHVNLRNLFGPLKHYLNNFWKFGTARAMYPTQVMCPYKSEEQCRLANCNRRPTPSQSSGHPTTWPSIHSANCRQRQRHLAAIARLCTFNSNHIIEDRLERDSCRSSSPSHMKDQQEDVLKKQRAQPTVPRRYLLSLVSFPIIGKAWVWKFSKYFQGLNEWLLWSKKGSGGDQLMTLSLGSQCDYHSPCLKN